MIAVKHLIERSHIKQVDFREESITIFAIKMADLTHHLVGIKQPAIRRVERQTHDGVLEDLLVALSQLLLFLLLLHHFGLVNQHTDNTNGLTNAWSIFCHTVITYIEPMRFTNAIIDIPSITILYRLLLTIYHLVDSIQYSFHIFWMNEFSEVLSLQLRLDKQAASQSPNDATRDIIVDDIVVSNLQSLLHHLIGSGGRGYTLTDTTTHKMVLYQHSCQ